MSKQKNKTIIVIISIMIIILSTLCILNLTGTINLKFNDKKTLEQNNTDNTENDTGNEYNGEFSGVVEVTGYPVIEKIGISYPGETYDYVYFHFTKTNNNKFEKYIESLSGNSYVRKDKIGIGCYIDGTINYYNKSDQLGDKTFSLSEGDTKKILNANEKNQIKLKLEKLPLTYGTFGTMCYSHITNIEVVD